MFLQTFQYFSCPFCVELLVIGIDEDVIHVDDKPSFCHEVAKDMVHQCLKGGRRVT